LAGQFASIAGLEGQSSDVLKFAGEHANSFYEWRGFMEGAALSGRAVASEILRDMAAGQL
jgi:monoamine oxidase